MISMDTLRKVVKAERKLFNFKRYNKEELLKLYLIVNNIKLGNLKGKFSDNKARNRQYYVLNRERILRARKSKLTRQGSSPV